MAIAVTSPIWQQVNTPALDMRRFLSVGRTEGVVATTDMAVAQRAAGANMSVDLAAGEALVQGDLITNQGLYYVYNDATFNLTGFAPANATNPRVDRITLKVDDAFHGGAGNTAAFQIVTGTATAGATLANLTGAASVPASSLLLANVLIPATATTVTTANIDTSVGIVRPTLVNTYLPYTPTWTSTVTAPAIGNAAVVARYSQVGKRVHCYGSIVFGSTSTFGSGGFIFALPVTQSGANSRNYGVVDLYDSSTAARVVGLAEQQAVGQYLILGPLAGALQVVSNTVPWTWAVNDMINWNFTYEAA